MIYIKFLKITLTAILLLLASAPVIVQSAPLRQPSPLLEIAHMFELDCGLQSQMTRVYVDGLVINEGKYKRRAKSGRCLDALTRTELRLEPEELAELISWTEQPDFLNARAEYVVKAVPDNPILNIITYRREGREKKIVVANYLIGSEAEKAKLPPSVLKLLEWERKTPF